VDGVSETTPDATSSQAAGVIMYSTVWCGYCQRLKAQMAREGIAFTEVDIEVDPQAAAFVESVNGGNQTVPTLVFPDGSAATNPPIGEVKARLGR
jgi:mycoredoxin